MAKISSLDIDLIDQSAEIAPQDLLKLGKGGKKSQVKVVEKECPAHPHIILCDVSLNARGPGEDKMYANNPKLSKNIRRGNTFMKIYDKYDHTLFKSVQVARKGLMKFYEMKQEYIVTDKDFSTYLAKSEPKTRGERIDKQEESNLRNYIFAPVIQALGKGHCIEVLKTLKANGKNAQVSWVESEGLWCIASKNVGILAKNYQDLGNYDQDDKSRYSCSIMIAEAWFKVLETIKKKGILLSSLKEKLAGKTLIGEYIGNYYQQHLIKYPKQSIIFYSIVDNYRSDTNCLLPEEAYDIFEQFGLYHVPVSRVGVFDNIEMLSDALSHEYNVVSSGSLKIEEEGSVLYMVSRTGEDK